MKRALTRAVFPALLVTAGCANSRESNVDMSSKALIGAEPSPAGTDDDAVLLLHSTADGEGLCTATLVAPNLALTARHCVAFGGPPLFQCTPQGELVQNPIGGGTLGADYPPETIELYSMDLANDVPAARVSQIISSQSDTICKNDIAFVVLDRELGFEPRAMRLESTTSTGEEVTLVGYGATVTGEKLEYKTRTRRRLEKQTIVDVGPDSPSEPVLEAPPRTLLLEGPSACSGDSGGPAFAQKTGALVGSFSILGGDDCSANDLRLFYTHVAPFGTLIAQAFAAVGSEPIPETVEPPDAGTSSDASTGVPAAKSGESGCTCAPTAVHGFHSAILMGSILALARSRRRSRA